MMPERVLSIAFDARAQTLTLGFPRMIAAGAHRACGMHRPFTAPLSTNFGRGLYVVD